MLLHHNWAKGAIIMNIEEGHSAEEVAGILRSAGYEVTRRTVNYYAFEKKMFQPKGTGKKIFTREDIDRMQAILYLRERSSLTLDEIKKIIGKDDFSLFDIECRFGKKEQPILFSMSSSGLKEVYDLEIVDRHIIVKIADKKILLSTGAQVSLSKPSTAENRLTLLGQAYNLAEEHLNTTVEEISEMAKLDFDVLLSGDILKKLHVTLDLDNQKATFTDWPQDHRGLPLKVDLVLDIPVFEMTLAEKPLRLFFDTGARASFLRSDLIENYPFVAKERDFYPGIGELIVDTFEIPVKLAGVNISVNFGSLPKLLEMALLMAGCDGILGFDFFRYFSPVYFNLPGRLLSITKRIVPLP